MHGGIVDLAVVVAGDGEDRRSVSLVGLVKLGVVVVVQAGEVDDVAHVIAEQRGVFSGFREGRHHLIRDVGLKLAVLNAAGVT